MQIKEIEVTVKKYQDSKGNTHNTRESAEISQAKIDGLARVCHFCKGSKKVENEDGRGFYNCDHCDKNGLVWKKEVWGK